MHLGNVCADISGKLSDVEKERVHIGKVSNDVNEASRDIEKSLMHVIDVSMHLDSASRELRGNPFEPLFSPADMHEEKKDVVFSLPEVHPPAILHAFCAFVPKQAAPEHNPASTVHNGNAVQRTQIAGREAIAHGVQKPAKRPSCGPVEFSQLSFSAWRSASWSSTCTSNKEQWANPRSRHRKRRDSTSFIQSRMIQRHQEP